MLNITLFLTFNFTTLQSNRTRRVFLNYSDNGRSSLWSIPTPTEAADVVPDRIALSSNPIAINEASAVDNETIHLAYSPLTVTVFKFLCFYKPISNERLKCMLRHENEQKYKNDKLRYTMLPVLASLRHHLINYHRISTRVLNTVNEYSDGLVTISLTSMVI